MALLQLLLIALISSATASTPTNSSSDIDVATQEMQRATYFTFVMLLNMAPPDLIQGNITFLMPNDKTLAKTNMVDTSVVDFLLGHSIPMPLLMENLVHFPTGSFVPTSRPGYFFKVSNEGRRQFFLGNVRVMSPNICTKGSSIRCHGIDDVVQPTTIPQPNLPPPSPPCSSSASGPAAAAAPLPAPSPPSLAPSSDDVSPVPNTAPASVIGVSRPWENSSHMCNAGILNLAITFLVLAMW